MQYGPIVDIDLKLPPRPPGYAFIEASSNCTNFLIFINMRICSIISMNLPLFFLVLAHTVL